MVTSKGPCANCLAADRPPNPAPMITTRGRRGTAWAMWVMMCLASLYLGIPVSCSFANADDHIGVQEKRQVGCDLEFGRGCGCEARGRDYGLAFGQGAKEDISAGRKTPDFDLKKWPRHQGGFGAPSVDHAVFFIALMVLPNRHDWETRLDQAH